MIFVTVGTQLPFDRLVKAVDEWAQACGRTDVVAQVGRSSYEARAIRTYEFMAPDDFVTTQRQAELLVAHCGTGSMLSALEIGQPVLMMPRLHKYGEHRNDHQLATANHLRGRPGVYIANDEQELVKLLDAPERLVPPSAIAEKAPDPFVANLRSILAGLAS